MSTTIQDPPPKPGPWLFREVLPSRTILATEPCGRQHVIKGGKMDSEAGAELLNRMVLALSQPAQLREQENTR